MAFGSLIKPNGNQLPDVALLFYLDKAQKHYKLFWPSDFFISLVSRPTNATWYWLQGENFCISEHSLLWNVHSYKLPLKMLAIKPRRFFPISNRFISSNVFFCSCVHLYNARYCTRTVTVSHTS